MEPFLIVRQESASYPVYVGSGLLARAGSLVMPRGRVFVITSTSLLARFGDRVSRSFAPAADVVAIGEGEARKTLETANDIVTQLLDRGAKRDSMAVVVGGGMLGDTAGFEVLKGGVIGDPDLFELLERREIEFDEIVQRAIAVKARIVSADEKESDVRRLLNYGHTIAHGIEAAMHFEGMTHGEAVGWGMIAANAIAVRRTILARDVAARIDNSIRAYEPTPLPRLDPGEIFAATEHDKKNTGSSRVMVFPRRIGECVVENVSDDDVRYGIEAVV